MSKSERVNYYHEDGSLAGEVNRAEAEKRTLILGAAMTFLLTPEDPKNTEERVWLQLRRHDTAFPNCLDATGCGAVGAGEDMVDAALRELFEESKGVQINREDVVAADLFMNSYVDEAGRTIKRWTQICAARSAQVPQVNDEVAGFICVPLTTAKHWADTYPAIAVPMLSKELSVVEGLIRPW